MIVQLLAENMSICKQCIVFFQALRKAHEATKSARESSEKVDDALKKVNDILIILGESTGVHPVAIFMVLLLFFWDHKNVCQYPSQPPLFKKNKGGG